MPALILLTAWITASAILAAAIPAGAVPPGGSALAASVQRPPRAKVAAPADSMAEDTTEADSTAKPVGPWYRRPKYIMFRSILVPGWGQWANHKHVKALVVAGGEGYLIYEAFDWGHTESDYNHLAAQSTGNPSAQAFYRAEALQAAGHRRDFTWWTIFATVLSMGDAYVDAQLGRQFDAQFKPQDQSHRIGGGSDPLAFQAAINLRLP